jgi:predicted GNAT family N-acyltransferase
MRIAVAQTEAARQACFDIRRAVFIVEQDIPEAEEWDEHDAGAVHFLGDVDGVPAATARLIPAGGTAKIGRVAVTRGARGTGRGLALMRHVLNHARESGFSEAALDAQTYALPFYERLGFIAEGPEFDDGSGILHQHMRRDLAARPDDRGNRAAYPDGGPATPSIGS